MYLVNVKEICMDKMPTDKTITDKNEKKNSQTCRQTLIILFIGVKFINDHFPMCQSLGSSMHC